jgi:cell wall assembly regulator SMI1
MNSIWKEFEDWLDKNCPHFNKELNVGVVQHEVDLLESKIGTPLPSDFIDFYKIHNGQNSAEGLINGEILLPFDRILYVWKKFSDLLELGEFNDDDGNLMTVSHLDKGIKNNWWNPKWIPITSDGCGKHVCIDMDPAGEGSVGQIITIWNDIDARKLISRSFKDWINSYVNDVKDERYVYKTPFGVVALDSIFASE